MIPTAAAPLPWIMYGTAWKEERTTDLTTRAFKAGFRAFDTANQRKHYYEEGVGQAIQALIEKDQVSRENLFLQTKFTYQSGQDHRLPYDPKAAIETQVVQSFESSLAHFNTTYLDSYVLHGPELRRGLSDNDWKVWHQMERFVEEGRVRYLGVSNVSFTQLAELLAGARIRPQFVQNRCYPSIAWDMQTRALCEREHLIYQGFSLIRDPMVTESKSVIDTAKKYGCTIPQLIYRWAMQQKMLLLVGTTNDQHMKEALQVESLKIPDADLSVVGEII